MTKEKNSYDVSNGDGNPKKTIDDYEAEKEENEEPERDTWGGKFDFLMSSLSFAVGMGNMWRFPYLCYRNGGGAFLIPYIIMMIFAGMPMMLLEFCFGQYGRLGVVSIWKVCPLFQGIGWSMFLVSLITCTYYNMLNAWCIYYIVSSLAKDVPWRDCFNVWNTDSCGQPDLIVLKKNCTAYNATYFNGTCLHPGDLPNDEYDVIKNSTADIKLRSPSDQYFHNEMLRMSSGITDFDAVNYKLVLCFLFVWLVVLVCLIKGIKSSGKATYFTSLFPYVVLIILFVRGVTLEGASDGIIFYLTPEWGRLLSPKVWVDAAIQVFFSLSTCWGGLITLASYNGFKNNALRDALFVSTGDCLTSIFGGVVVFSFIGYMANVLGTEVSEVATQGAGLAFIVYPEAVTTLPLSPLWSILFMLMLLNVGIGTQFGLVTTVHTTLIDVFNKQLAPGRRPMIVLAVLCLVCYIGGLPICSGAGIYILQLMDNYSATYTLLFNGIMLCVALLWCYGKDNFSNNIQQMLGHAPNAFIVFCWRFISPILLTVLLFFVLYDFKRTTYDDYTVPAWSECIGWMITLTQISVIPVVACYHVYHSDGHTIRQKLKNSMTSSHDWFKDDTGKPKVDRSAMYPLTEMNEIESKPTDGAIA